jgi:heptosyltransferase-2
MHHNETVHCDCRHFVGDRPCDFHKREGVKCASCPYYDPYRFRVLMVKLGAAGDVLRTTSLLTPLHERYPGMQLTWITHPSAVELLQNNPRIDRIVSSRGDGLARLQVEAFDVVLCPEAAHESAALATLANGSVKKGFGLHHRGYIFPYNSGARTLFQLGLFDDLKKANQLTNEQLLCRLAGVPYQRVAPSLLLTAAELRFAQHFSHRLGLDPKRTLVGLNTGGGGRWRLKRWRRNGFIRLARRLANERDAQILVLGGPSEEEINQEILRALGPVAVDGGCHNTVRQFASLLNLCDVVVTGDSMALHIVLAMGKRVVALFGPTSVTEIDLYGLGTKIVPDMDCTCCYLTRCDKNPNCMQHIASATVFEAVSRELAQLADEKM